MGMGTAATRMWGSLLLFPTTNTSLTMPNLDSATQHYSPPRFTSASPGQALLLHRLRIHGIANDRLNTRQGRPAAH